MTATDWATVASLGTALGTLILAVATFASVRSGYRAARVAERALLASTQPIMSPTRREDPETKIMFADGHWVKAAGGTGVAEATPEAVYLAIPVRNVGSGLGVLHSWSIATQTIMRDTPHGDPATFHRLTRDLYVPPGDLGFWQGALRDATTAEFAMVTDAINNRERLVVDILYGNHEGSQRVISRFSLVAAGDTWVASVSRHWNLDRPQPR